MGIKSLFKIIKSQNQIIDFTNINNYKYKKIAIDISIIIYQIVISIRNSGKDYRNNKGELVSHIYGLFNKIISYLEKKIIPIFVFDGKPPDLKNKTLKNRKKNKQKAFEKMQQAKTHQERIKYFKRCVVIKKQDLDLCRKLLDLMGVPYVNAPEEADSQCARLVKEGLADAVATEDMDILTFGSSCILRDFSVKKRNVIQIKLDKILQHYNITHDQFIKLCILLGCDYFPTISGLSIENILKLVIEIKDNKKLIETINKKYNKRLNYTDFNKVIEYFNNPITIKVEEKDLCIKEINYSKLYNFLVFKNNFCKFFVKKKLKKLRNLKFLYI